MTIIHYPNMKHDVIMFNVGHGDCVLIHGNEYRGLLIDCGANIPRYHCPVPQFIERLLSNDNKCGFVVSHFHWDHYSLFRFFNRPNELFSRIFLPALPISGPGKQAARAVMEFLKVSVFSNFSHYSIMPEILTRTKRPIIACKRGDYIYETNVTFKVIWPDLSDPILGSPKIVEMANSVKETVEPLLERYDIAIPNEHEEYSTAQFFEELKDIRLRDLSEQETKGIHETLGRIENEFRGLADIFSLAFRTHYSRRSKFLFLGDLTNEVLDHIKIYSGNSRYDCVKASHHGTRYGRSLRNVSTEFLLVSRSQKEFPRIEKIHIGYIRDMQYRMILSTEFLGHCQVC